MSEHTFETLLGPNLRFVQTLVQRRLRTSDHAEDMVQTILLRAFQRRDQLRAPAKFRTWLWSIALNEIRSFFRSDRSTVSLEDLPHFEVTDDWMSPLLRLERIERSAWVRACIADLSERDRAVIRFRDLEEKSVRDAAVALNCSEAAAKTAHFRARRRLAQIMVSAPLGGRQAVAVGQSGIGV